MIMLLGEVLPYKRLMGRAAGWGHIFTTNAVTFSVELLEWGRTFSDFWG